MRILLLLFLAVQTFGFSQSSLKRTTEFDKHIWAETCFSEVYSSVFKDHPDLKKRIIDALEFRVTIVPAKENIDINSVPTISSVGLSKGVDKLVMNRFLTNFSEFNFNPLCFSIDLFPIGKSVKYRIDGTNYLLIIQPQ